VTVRTVERCATPRPVYDITVEGEPEFFANGILVHNCDEIAAWGEAQHCWDMLTMTLRIGERPQVIVATTPRPVPIIRELLRRAERDVYVVRGSTWENEDNLAPSFLSQLRARYAGTRLGRQELEAELLDDVPGALWTRAMLDACQLRDIPPKLPPRHSPDYGRAFAEGLGLVRVVVGVDPSGAKDSSERADETGIVVAGIDHHERGYVLEDASGSYSPDSWGKKTIEMFDKWGADRIVAEANFGGGMVQANIRTTRNTAPVVLVTASRGKAVRAEPVAALYEQGRVTHCDYFPKLEEQLGSFTRTGYHGDGSPDRADSLVWTLTDLMLNTEPPYSIYDLTGIRPPGT
jgi:phage terminase large subunit-like protein